MNEEALQVALEEFKVMHAQILERSRRQQQFVAAGAALSVGVIAALTAVFIPRVVDSSDLQSTAYFLLTVSFPFYLIAFAHAYQDYMIAVTAAYIQQDLRRQLIELTGSDRILRNEIWFADARAQTRPFALGWASVYLLFLAIPFALLIYYVALLAGHYEPGPSELFAQIGLLVLNAVFIAFAVYGSALAERYLRTIADDSAVPKDGEAQTRNVDSASITQSEERNRSAI